VHDARLPNLIERLDELCKFLCQKLPGKNSTFGLHTNEKINVDQLGYEAHLGSFWHYSPNGQSSLEIDFFSLLAKLYHQFLEKL
jgi:hypothetical protein